MPSLRNPNRSRPSPIMRVDISRQETISQFDMPVAEALRQEQFQRLAKQCRAVMSEHALGLPVDHLDLTGLSGQHQRARRCLHHAGETILSAAGRNLIAAPGQLRRIRPASEFLVKFSRIKIKRYPL